MSNVLMHYGVIGMRWGVMRAIRKRENLPKLSSRAVNNYRKN